MLLYCAESERARRGGDREILTREERAKSRVCASLQDLQQEKSRCSAAFCMNRRCWFPDVFGNLDLGFF